MRRSEIIIIIVIIIIIIIIIHRRPSTVEGRVFCHKINAMVTKQIRSPGDRGPQWMGKSAKCEVALCVRVCVCVCGGG